MNEDDSFKDIPFTDGKYSISRIGAVMRNSTSHILKPFKNNMGYLCVDLRLNNETKRFLIHRLVAMTYIRIPKDAEIVNHMDCNSLNNSVENLEWCSYSYNNKYAYDHGNRVLTEKQLKARKREKTYLHKRVFQYDEFGNLVRGYKSLTEAADAINGTVSSISACLYGRIRTYKGYVWKNE